MIDLPTSSIFHNIKITVPKAAEMFVDALEKASKLPKRVPTSKVNPPLRDKEAIRKLFSKRLNDND